MHRTPSKAVQVAEPSTERMEKVDRLLDGEEVEFEYHVAEAHCYDCDEHYGPQLAENVGEWMAFDHMDCDMVIETNWTETEKVKLDE